jgi:hypothetical protein
LIHLLLILQQPTPSHLQQKLSQLWLILKPNRITYLVIADAVSPPDPPNNIKAAIRRMKEAVRKAAIRIAKAKQRKRSF